MAFVTDSNRPQPLWQPPPTACLTASGTASEAPSLLMHPCPLPHDPPPVHAPRGSTGRQTHPALTPAPDALHIPSRSPTTRVCGRALVAAGPWPRPELSGCHARHTTRGTGDVAEDLAAATGGAWSAPCTGEGGARHPPHFGGIDTTPAEGTHGRYTNSVFGVRRQMCWGVRSRMTTDPDVRYAGVVRRGMAPREGPREVLMARALHVRLGLCAGAYCLVCPVQTCH